MFQSLYIYIYIYIYISLSLSLSLSVYIYIYICICIYTYIYIYMCVYRYLEARLHTIGVLQLAQALSDPGSFCNPIVRKKCHFGGYRDITTIMENQMEKKMENGNRWENGAVLPNQQGTTAHAVFLRIGGEMIYRQCCPLALHGRTLKLPRRGPMIQRTSQLQLSCVPSKSSGKSGRPLLQITCLEGFCKGRREAFLFLHLEAQDRENLLMVVLKPTYQPLESLHLDGHYRWAVLTNESEPQRCNQYSWEPGVLDVAR